jgi:hypothetical protein
VSDHLTGEERELEASALIAEIIRVEAQLVRMTTHLQETKLRLRDMLYAEDNFPICSVKDHRQEGYWLVTNLDTETTSFHIQHTASIRAITPQPAER